MSVTTIGRVLCVAGVLLAGAAAPARADEWVLLGERRVKLFGADRDTIPVTAAEGRFKRIKIKVEGNDLELLDLKVTFGNGEVEDVPVRQRIAEGGETRAIDLPGEARVIKTIMFVYKTDGGGPRRRVREGNARVVVYGKQAEGGGGGDAKPADKPAAKQEWVKLGERRVQLFGADKDAIPVSGAEGVFRRIKLKVTENGVEMLDLKVHFANGETQDVQVRTNIREGGETRVIDLEGAARVIEKIVMTYKTAGGLDKLKGRALVTVYGLRQGDDPTPRRDGGDAKPAAAGGDWEHLGEREVRWRVERDVIPVTAKEGRFTKIKLAVRGNGIHFLDLKVEFGNGETVDVPVRAAIPENGETRTIDLPGEARVIKQVTFAYETAGPRGGGRATVHLWGKH